MDNLCEHVHFDAVASVFPYVAEALDEVDSPVTNVMTCSATVGVSDDPDKQGVFTLYVEVFDDTEKADDHYERFYKVNCDWNPLFTDKRPWPDGLFEALTETIRGTMASLHIA